MAITNIRKLRRKRRTSINMVGTSQRPRIAVFRSNRYIYAQAIDDSARATLAAFSSLQLKDAKQKKSEQAKEVGKKLAQLLKEKNITEAIFDRGMYAYEGRVKTLAEGLREGELKV